MTQTAIVLVIKDTGNVLATVTRAGDPASAPSAADLAGERFPIRDGAGATVVEVPVEALDSKAVPLVDDLLIKPQACGVQDDAATLILLAAPTVTLTADGVKVAVTAPVSADAAVWVLLESGAGGTRRREVLTQKILERETDVKIPMTLAQANYDVVAFVAGHLPAKANLKVT
jgi:hypothetical protein